jgi:cell shape-determining protein MreD
MIVQGLLSGIVLLATTFGVGLYGQHGDGLARYIVPMLPYVIVHTVAVRRPEAMPSWLVFVAGLSVDFLTHGALGYFALIYLTGLFCVHAAPAYLFAGRGSRMLVALGTLCAIVLLQFVVLSIYALELHPLVPLAWSAAVLAPLLLCAEWCLPHASERLRGYGADAVTLQRNE